MDKLESPVLIALAKEGNPHQPPEQIACRLCKAAIWIETQGAVTCFCNLMKNITWDSNDWMTRIELCDGRFLAEKMAEEEERKKEMQEG